HVAPDGKLQYLLRRVVREALPIDFPSLEKGGLTLEKAVHLALAHARTLGYVVLDELMVHDVEAQPICKTRCDILAQRGHLARHCNHSHNVLPRRELAEAGPVAAMTSLTEPP